MLKRTVRVLDTALWEVPMDGRAENRADKRLAVDPDSGLLARTSMKKVLMICYAFPPMNAAASMHSLLYAKALPEFAWLPIVLTIKGRRDRRDDTLGRDLPKAMRVFRTATFDPVGAFERWRMRKSKEVGTRLSSKNRGRSGLTGRHISSMERIKQVLLAPLSTPDCYVSWLPFAVMNGAWLIQKYNIDVIFSTSPPHSTHLIAYWLSRISGRPWVVEFQDPWVASWPNYQHSKYQLRKKVDSFLEKVVVTSASAVLSNTHAAKEILLNRYGLREIRRIEVITNGYDADEIAPIKTSPFKKFTICHAGTLYPYTKPYYFFDELSRWYHGKSASERKKVDTHVQIILMNTQDRMTRRVIRDLCLSTIVEITDCKPYHEALQIQKSSDLLLLSFGFARRNNLWIPSKLFTYLGCRKPILALLPEGEAAEIVRGTRSGFVITSEKNGSIVEILERGYQQKLAGKQPFEKLFCFDGEKIRGYEKRELTKKLARIFEHVS